MKSEEEKGSEKNSLRTVKLFCLAVIGIILISLIYRAVFLIQKSKFDGQSGFIMAFRQTDGKKAVLYTFNPRGESITITTISGMSDPAYLRRTAAIPLDGYLTERQVSDKSFPLDISSYSLYSPREKIDISLLDLLRFWWLFRSTSELKQTHVSLTLPEQEANLDEILVTQFIDTRVEDDKKTIAIVNATTISGLGSRLERVLSRVGASVISITTAHQTSPTSKIIYYGEGSYTVSRLAQILSYPVEQRSGSNVSDIIIEIGEDQQRTTLF